MDGMAKIPDQPQEIFVPLTQDYLDAFGRDLVSLMLYGSAAGGSYVKGKSDINLLVVLTPEGMNRLEDSFAPVKKWRKRNVAVPLVLTKEFIASSLDAYPIEFLNMKHHCVLIYGENVLESLDFKPEDLRLQIERELKSKIILLREGYLESGGSARRVRQLIGRSLTSLVSIFNAMLHLTKSGVPRHKKETIEEASRAFAIDATVFARCFDIKAKEDHLSGKEVIGVFKQYLREVEKVCHKIDGLK
jgi:predicted nucleotidyltransferase